MKFPASEEEKQLVYQTADELAKSLESAGERAADLAGLLHENFLALNEEYRKHIFAALSKINEEEWKIKIQKVNLITRKQEERIISQR